ncbi:polyamine ABC transporter ATP-binding protein [Ferrimonas marina]|uniref:Spermidine/putrescine import ATP-binding protein PotA n=1 Tax=Ferrimonas marina TaxID=299255 RepID=A0A1M5ZHT8_9GAMM|nr:polyamine ABC transporter ATP-binding protein [Ferrimonas marina]SHI23885.1 putrescine transport system ATP-binding protein [Ferrimonas marina]
MAAVEVATTQPAGAAGKPSKPLLEIRNVGKSFDGIPAVDDVSLTIDQGEIFALLGASGCGKSTLLRMLAGFETPSAGQILLDGQDLAGIPPHLRPVNMMFQSYALFPHMSVWDNIAFGLKQDKLPKEEIASRVKEMLELVDMSQYARRKPHQLSGGQRQRIALARSLAKRPKLLLLDEPMGALDKKLREKMQLEVVDILERVGVTCVMVTHDQEEAMTMAWRVAIMNQGKLVQVGSPEEIYEHPNCRMSAEFIGSVNLFEGNLSQTDADSALVESQDLLQPLHLAHGVAGNIGSALTVAVRPEKITLSHQSLPTQPNSCSGTVEDIAYLGGQSIYHVRLDSGKKVIATLPNSSRYRKNLPKWEEKVWLSWESDSNMVLAL